MPFIVSWPGRLAPGVYDRPVIQLDLTATVLAAARKVMEDVLRQEIVLAKRLHVHEIQSRDSRIGFEASNQYYYVTGDLMEKVLNCRDLLARVNSE